MSAPRTRIPGLVGVSIIAAVLFALPAATAEQPDAAGARALIETTVDEVMVILNDSSLDTPARRERLEALAWERFDFSTMSRAVVAKYWRRFSEEQKTDFIAEFKAFLSRTYGVRIERYTTETVEIVGQRTTSRGNEMVLTRIVGGEFGGAEVEYMLKPVGGGWRVIDVKIEGISLVLNYRDQFKSILARDGADGLLEALRKKNIQKAET